MERSERLKQSKKSLEDAKQPATPEHNSNPRASVFGEKFSTMKERNPNRETLTLGTNRQTVMMAKTEEAKEEEPKPDENEPGILLIRVFLTLSCLMFYVGICSTFWICANF
jgi:hypothetical protein